MDNTCQNCPDRSTGCHGKCLKYLKARMKQDIANKKRFEENDLRTSHITYCKDISKGQRRISDAFRTRRRKDWVNPNEVRRDEDG